MTQDIYRQQIQALKEQKRIVYKDIAATTGIKYGTLLNWLNGTCNFSAAKLRKIKEIIQLYDD